MDDSAIFERTSVRTFTDQPVSHDEVDRLMRAAMAAPTAGNQQPWDFIVTDDKDVKEKLAECSPYAGPARHAPLVIIPCMRTDDVRFPSCAPLDMSAAVENILLEACSMGLGGVWMAIYPEEERMGAVADVIDMPKGSEPFALVAVGHPEGEPSPRSAKRYEPERVHWV